MLRNIFTLVVCVLATILTVSAQTPPDNEVWYTTTDGKKAELYYWVDDDNFKIISHTYANGKGVVRANRAIEDYGNWVMEEEEFGFKIIGNHIETITLPNSVTMIGWSAFEDCTSLTSVNIPNSVTEIGLEAFKGCTNLRSITIPDSVTQIEWYAFLGCTGLKSFKGKYASSDGRCLIKDGELIAFAPAGLTSYTIPDSVTEIGWHAFDGCTSLKSINIPNSVTEIGDYAFEGCTSLTNITIPNSVTGIGEWAFAECTSLTSITIPDSATGIGRCAFNGCTSLTNITIPNSITNIGDYVFSGCTSLPIINKIRYADTYLVEAVDKSLTSYTIKAGTRFIGYGAFEDCTSLTSITIPDSVTQIEDYAFMGCTSLTNITIPDSVTEIEWHAFRGCTSLTSINIPNSVKSIGGFLGCTGLTSITIPNSVNSIGGFLGCTGLTSITIPDSVTKIEGYAFEGCTSLKSINIPDSVTEIGWGAFRGCTSLTNITIPNSVTGIGPGAFEGCNIEQITISAVTGNVFRGYDGLDPSKVVAYIGKYASEDGRCLIKDGVLIDYIHNGAERYEIPNGVTIISDEVFKGCSSLKSITIPEGVTCIGSMTFSGCTSLTSINIPNSVTEIGYYSFEGCTNLKSITIPDSVTVIGRNAFYGCTSLESFNGKYASADGRCLIKDGVLFVFVPAGLTSYTIPYGVTKIGWHAFEGCTSLTSINIPDSVTEIGYYSFEDCTNLKSITIPDSVTEIGGDAFRGCTSLPIINKIRYADTYLVEAVDKSLTSYTIKAGTKFIGHGAFDGCTSLTSVTIPDSVTWIGSGAFSGCTSLTSINIPNSVTKIEGGAFDDCTSLKSITIPNSVTEIGWGAFLGCTSLPIINKIRYADTYLVEAVDKSLTSYTIKAGTIFIGHGAFAKCTSLTSITIPDSVTQIGDGAFNGCTRLTNITIPNSVTEIGDVAFNGCTSLTNITIPNSVTEIGDDAFRGCNIKQITINTVTGNIFRGCDGLDPSKVVAYTGKYASEDGRCLIKDGVLIDYIHNGAERYEIPNGVTIIGDEVFKGCSTLKEITIPNSVTVIGEGAFEDCNIEQITINAVTGNIFRGRNGLDPSKVVAYTGKYASEDGRCLIKDGVLIDIIHTGLTSYAIPENITTIGKGVFKGCSTLKDITIPNSVTMIGEGAFEDCNIERITINAVTGNIFQGCNGLDPSKVVAYTDKYASEDGRCLIKDGVLIDIIHTGLTSYYIPEGVTTIPHDTFRGCTELTSLTLPQSLTTIGERAFMGCGITEITIPQGVATIGQDAFKECPLTIVINCLATTPPQIATLGIGEEIVIYVPKESVKLYKKAKGWEVYKKQIKRIKVEK